MINNHKYTTIVNAKQIDSQLFNNILGKFKQPLKNFDYICAVLLFQRSWRHNNENKGRQPRCSGHSKLVIGGDGVYSGGVCCCGWV